MKRLLLWLLLALGVPFVLLAALYLLVLNLPVQLVNLWFRLFDKLTLPPPWMVWMFPFMRFVPDAESEPEAGGDGS